MQSSAIYAHEADCERLQVAELRALRARILMRWPVCSLVILAPTVFREVARLGVVVDSP
jgi:hypothetical protein